MRKNRASGQKSRFSEWLKGQRRQVLLSLAFIYMFAYAWPFARAQAPETSITAYGNAIKQSTISDRIAAMEHYLSLPTSGSLRVDALEFLIWDHLRLNHQTQSVQRAQELLAISPANPIAIAVLNQNPPNLNQKKSITQEQLVTLKSAVSGLDHLTKPEGMLDRNFQMLKQQVAIMLNGAMGLRYLELEDYPDARPALQQAADSDPNNPQWVYGLALALLNGKNPDQYRGFWYMARAVNLSEQTPQGQAISSYARKRYHESGGKEDGWQRYLVSAAALDAPPSPASGNETSTRAAAVNAPSTPTIARNAARSSTDNRNNATTASASPAVPALSNPKDNSTSAEISAPARSKSKVPSGFEATLHEPPAPEAARAPAVPNRPKIMAPPSEAVSLGILIETSLLTSQNRGAIIATLKDIVHSMRANDEACILVFSDQLDFEQDLTADDQLLEEALSQIRPQPGKALLPGIAFAAGHLKRIGKNANRVLLVISDGRSTQTSSDTLMFRSQLSGVRVDCIGLKAEGSSDRALLEQVASYSGGKASFADDSGQFRTVALQMTRGMGIDVR
ncbi:MAG TPA: tetratricopeptide repeat protein [Candidatus Angelobacter sp.]|nr:tetratricopeptide repeat protein [Candidatus Angelobacter sp.]